MSPLEIHTAALEDAGEIAALYAPYVEQTAITFSTSAWAIGALHQCGYKFGRWYGIAWMEKHISPHPCPPPAFRAFGEL
ncbi:MAG: hypothetical protein HFE43_01380 [Oscillospiraceae bacterium]|jgi:L-amino acid N-acyltransferase YncA|nr:hypothetical protein [Oscillospiraceae bacterium]